MFFTPVQKLKININPVYYRDEHCKKNIKKWSLTQIKYERLLTFFILQ